MYPDIFESAPFFLDSRISTSTHICIQIEFAHPHVSDRCPDSLKYPGLLCEYCQQSMHLKACEICILLCLKRTVELEYSIHSKELGSILLTINSLYRELQSSYRQHHSMETASLKVMNDVLLNMNSQQVTLMVLLDLSTVFDTVNPDILLERLDKDIGMRSVMLGWFRSYLSNRCQRVCIDGSLSNQRYLNCGAPQGSCLGPPLFVMYTSSLSRLLNVISLRLIVTQMIRSYT